ncbi:hypothetical protein C362_01181 [Cryptococcus neoformans Bt1]|nr:hypothetical protein C362_01181 [Cryptococcus neoformans var. grubii Bt1]OXG30951.1 hypothetical protein C367_01672 [Cryptococcus neoformans var. grubii Ze90-1]
MVAPPTLDPKLAFWIRVLTTSRGAATVMEATAPAMEATKSIQVFPFFQFYTTRNRTATYSASRWQKSSRKA